MTAEVWLLLSYLASFILLVAVVGYFELQRQREWERLFAALTDDGPETCRHCGEPMTAVGHQHPARKDYR